MRKRPGIIAGILIAGLAACAPTASEVSDSETCVDPAGFEFGYPMDDDLRINEILMKGTHNSYHVEPPDNDLVDWAYTHAPLTVQLAEQGVRQFELDVHWNPDEAHFEVYHVPIVDAETTCLRFTDCLSEMRQWSEANPGHHPVFVFVEPKDDIDPASASIQGHYGELDAEIRKTIPACRRIEPDDLRGAYGSLSEALMAEGWPTLGEARGKFLFVMLDTDSKAGGHHDNYTHGGTSLRGRAMFITARSEKDPYAGVFKMDGPVGQAARIRAAVADGWIVRTRADSTDEPRIPDYSRQLSAVNSGAQMVSTDFPAPGMIDTGYWLPLTGGTPSRCNPVVAPPDCTPDAVESPARLKPEGT